MVGLNPWKTNAYSSLRSKNTKLTKNMYLTIHKDMNRKMYLIELYLHGLSMEISVPHSNDISPFLLTVLFSVKNLEDPFLQNSGTSSFLSLLKGGTHGGQNQNLMPTFEYFVIKFFH